MAIFYDDESEYDWFQLSEKPVFLFGDKFFSFFNATKIYIHKLLDGISRID